MKSLKCIFVLFVFVGLLIVSCSDEQQLPVNPTDQGIMEKVTLNYFTTGDIPIGLTGEGTIKLVGENWILKDVGVIENITSNDPIAAGTMTHYLSATMNAETGEGPIHGHWTIIPEGNTEGGYWEGNYTGYRSKMPGSDTLFILPLQLVGHGKGGTIDGFQMHTDVTITAWGTPPVGWYGSGEGFYKSH
jgi:hypothetical protein